MPCNRGTASAQLNRMSTIQGFGFISPEAFTSLVDVLSSHAVDGPHARAAVDLLLTRKSLPAGPQDIADALNEVRAGKPVSEAPRATSGGCGRVLDGYTYWHYVPGEKTKVLLPSRCIDGEIRITQWRKVPGLVDEDGNDLKQPYDFTGRCKCAGGWL